MKKLNIKKFPLGVITLVLLVGFVGCGKDEENKDMTKTKDVTVMSSEENSKEKEEKEKEKVKATSKKSNSLDKKATEIYIKKAEDDIALLNKGKIEELKKQFSEVMGVITTKKDLDGMVDMIKKAGNFEKLEEKTVEEDANSYVTKMTVKYSKSNLIFTISYDDNNKIIGMFIK